MKPRKDGYYHKNFTYEGRRYHISAVTERELMVKYGRMLQQLADGTLLINQNSTVAHWAEVWLETYKAGNMTDKSFLTYRQKLEGYIIPAIGRMKMKDVREPHLQRILNDERGRSFSHVSKLRMAIRSMFSRAYSAGTINRDPAANLVLPKTEAGRRDIPIPPRLLAELQRCQRGPFEPVLHQARDHNKPHTESSIKSMWRSYKRLMDIEMGAKVFRLQVIEYGEPDEPFSSLTPYCFRHTYCTDLQDAGVPLNVAKYLMGHSDITMTANIYTHTSEIKVQQAAELTAKYLEYRESLRKAK